MRVVDVLRQAALLPEGDAGAAGARVVPALQVHDIDMPRQVVLRLLGAVGARVVTVRAHFLVDVGGFRN